MTLDAVPVQVVVGASEADVPDTLTIRVIGELDMQGCARVQSQLVAAIATAKRVVLDLAELTFCDSSGLAVFCVARETAVAEGRTLVLCNVAGPVRRVFAISGLDDRFGLAD